MKGVNGCPRCGGEVEVTRVKDKITEIKKKVNGKMTTKHIHEKQYRLQCKHCGYTVGRGVKFPEETDKQGAERIKQYEAFIEDQLARNTENNDWSQAKTVGGVWKQSWEAEQRDFIAKHPAMFEPDYFPESEIESAI